jgi:hypothetical protein
VGHIKNLAAEIGMLPKERRATAGRAQDAGALFQPIERLRRQRGSIGADGAAANQFDLRRFLNASNRFS